VAAAAFYMVALYLFSKTKGLAQNGFLTGDRSFVYLPAFTLLIGLFSSALVTPDKAEGFAVTNIIRTHPAFQNTSTKDFSAKDFSQIATDLHFKHPPILNSPAQHSKPLNVVLIVLESTYNKYLSLFGSEDETEPLLKKYKERMELFPNFYSTFPNSFHARFTVLSGLYPIREPVSVVNPRIDSKSLIELLHDEGYSTSIYQSDPREYLRFADYLANREIDHYYDCANMPGKERFKTVSWGVPEQATMEAMTNAIASYKAGDKPFFMAYFPVAPHMPYDTPLKGFKKFPSKMQSLTKRDYSGEYKNTLLYIDWIMASILDRLQESGILDDTLVVITNDHGEMLGDENGMQGHGWRLKPELCNTPLIIMDPRHQGYHVNYALGSQVDLLPTVISLLGFKLPADNFYEGRPLSDTAGQSEKMIFFNSSDQRALIKDGKFYWEESRDRTPLVFTIHFEGTKTIFEKHDESAAVTGLLNEFEDFQNSLLRRYHSYEKQGFGQLLGQETRSAAKN
jgi:arylsulfatase A-like enzyme